MMQQEETLSSKQQNLTWGFKKDSHVVILKSGEKIPVSKTGYPKLKAVLGI